MTEKKKSSRRQSTAHKSNAIVVLGMHRSGTSALSGVLSMLGCSGPATPTRPSGNNEKRFFESQVICDLLDEILSSIESTWDDWMPFDSAWFNSPIAPPFTDQLGQLIEKEFSGSKLFLLENPRFCRMMPICLNALEQCDVEPYFVHTHRNPVEVAASLHRRNKIPAQESHLLWLRHTLDAEFTTRGQPRYFTNYTRLLDHWGRDLKDMQIVLGLQFPISITRGAGKIDDFLSPALRHSEDLKDSTLHNPTISEWVRTTYAIMETWAGTAGNSADFSELDRIRSQFDAIATNLGDLVQTGIDAPRTQVQAEESIQQSKHELKDTQTLLEQVVAEQSVNQKQIKTLEKSAGEQGQEVQHLAESLAEAKQERTALTAKLEDAQEAHATVIKKNATLNVELNSVRGELGTVSSALKQRSHEAEQTFGELNTMRDLVAELRQTETQKAAELISVQEKLTQEGKSKDKKNVEFTSKILNLEASEQQRFDELAAMTALILELQAAEREQAAEAKQERTALTAKLGDAQETHATVIKKNATLNVELNSVRGELGAAQERAAIAEGTTQIILSSTSWRLTGPLRWLVNAVRSPRQNE